MSKSPRLWPQLVLLTAIWLVSLAGCAHPIPSAGTSAACTAFGPIYFSRLKDTEETIAAVKRHNASWQAMCDPPH